MEASIQKWGNSNAIRLPKPILKTADIGEQDVVQIIALPNEIIIRKTTKKHIPLKERLKGFKGVYEAEKIEMTPVGDEVFWDE